MQRSSLGLLGFGALFAVVIAASAVGCQDDSNSSSDNDDGGSGGSGAGTTTTSSGDGGAGTGTGGTMTTGTGGGGTGGSGGGGGLPVVTIQEINNGTIPTGVDVEVHGAVAMSRKYLVSKGSSGSCLWGVYLSAPGLSETAEYSGILALSYGEDAITDGTGQTVCKKIEDGPVGDAFPDDVKPGDILDVVGSTSAFLLNACASQPPENNPSQVKQRQLSFIDKVTRTGSGPVPTPHTLTPDELALLSSPTDQEFHDRWGGVKVRLQGPIAPVLYTNPQTMAETVTGPFGNIELAGTNGLKAGDKVYYVKNTVNECNMGPQFADTDIVWNYVDGFSTIDYCTWSLQPANKCLDFDPASDDCVAGLMCPP